MSRKKAAAETAVQPEAAAVSTPAGTVLELKAMPNAKALLLKAAATATRKPTMQTVAPRLAVRINGVTFEEQWIADYNAVCGFDGSDIGLTAPQVLASGLHLYLMARDEVPFPMLGMVHMRNVIEAKGELLVGQPHDIVVSFGETRQLPLGLEFDLHTRFLSGGEVVWSAVTTILTRIKGARVPGVKPAPLVTLDATQARYVKLNVPENQGRKYAKVSNDYNPIHLHARSAALFGFPKAIAHGMWTAARLLADISRETGTRPTYYEVRFKQPVFLPSSNMVKFQIESGSGQYQLLSAKDSKVLMEGVIR